ncbi:guanine deaminase [Marininema halotolerans]|uniref:Guanine deaminase n=1 Tax=Marininema halotolerans TaxID=1155944 RepID=A0A1I6PNN6_9BACL|nr:guanine deaminase [Marininema halotolerans]
MYNHHYFLQLSIQIAIENVLQGQGGGPFGALIVKDGQIVSTGRNQVLPKHDPTAHAEIEVIRRTGKRFHSPNLNGCILYSSSEPCPMCLSAAYWAKISLIVFATNCWQIETFGWDDRYIYKQMCTPRQYRSIPSKQLNAPGMFTPFILWRQLYNGANYTN